MDKSEFYTLRGYRRMDPLHLTESMEDYIEMICRLGAAEGYVRIGDLSRMLNVLPSSTSKMVNKLEGLGLVNFQKYGIIKPTEKGWEAGNYCIWRHSILEKFLCLINGSSDETREAEQIEHFMTDKTVKNIEAVSNYLAGHNWTP